MTMPVTHPEGDRENLDPEHRDAEIDLAPREKVKSLQHRDKGSQTDGESRQ
jgi:hypothetical protein